MLPSTMDRFVVGTGRCGSTLLSRMLSQHPETLSIFEFFTGLDHARRFAAEPLDGEAFAALLAQDQPVVTMALRRGYSAPEIVYPFGAPHARYTMHDELPWLLVTALSRMGPDPDRLFDATLSFARARPAAPVREHYRALFDFWTHEQGRRLWIERSGSSIEYLGELARLFPEARFLHLHRDGREVALSMREHRLYRLAISFLYDLPPEAVGGGGNAGMAALDAARPGAADDPITARLEQELPAAAYGRYWSDQLARGFAALPHLEPARYHAVAFEDLVERPGDVLVEVADFFDLGRGDWIDEAAKLVTGRPPRRFPDLPPAEQSALAEACTPGRLLLGV